MNELLIKAYVKGSMSAERVRGFMKDERGVTAVEYAIVLAGVAAVVAVIFGRGGTVETMLTGIFKTVSTQVATSMTKQP